MNTRYLAVAVVLFVGVAAAQDKPAPAKAVYTKVVLTEIHCMGCAKKIAKSVGKVDGVQEMRVDLEAHTIFVVHKMEKTPSPKDLWKAIEEADHTPTKMETPTQTFTSKPAK